MSNVGLFAIGLFVTLLVLGAVLLLVWGAVLDGRYDAEQRRRRADDPSPSPERVRVPV